MKGVADRIAITENASRGVVILVILLLVLAAVVIAFSRAFISTVGGVDPAVARAALVAAIALPAVLLGVTTVQVVRLLRRRTRREAGAALRLRLLLFFVLVGVFAAGPQVILGITFVDSAMGTWFSSSIGDALRGAQATAIQYNTALQQGLASFLDGPLAPGMVAEFRAAPARAWGGIHEINRSVDALQLFTEGGREAAFAGDARARLGAVPSASGQLVRPGATLLVAVRTFTVGGRRYTAVASTVLPAALRENAPQLTEGLTLFTALDRYRAVFRLVLVAFFFLFSLAVFFITILVSLLLTERIASPIAHLEDATRRVAEGDFGFRILTRPRDEVATLVDSFNAMISELERSRRKILQAERITAWQEIARRLAHEIRNPLTPIKLSAQRLLKRFGEAPETLVQVLPSSVTSIIREVENLERMLRDFGELAKLPAPRPAPVPLRALLAEVAAVYAHLSATVKVRLDEVPAGLVLTVDRDQVKRAFANLFTNAMHAMPDGGVLSVRASAVRKADAAWWRIAVSDTGHGIPEESLDSVFDPYFTTKEGGTGLGLPIVRRIVFDHGGNVWAESDGATGTTIFIDLPEKPPGHPGQERGHP